MIDIGTSSSLENVKLIETSDGQRAPYVALSHCWGRSTPFITTRDNLDERKREILVEKAPATFQDAILVSRALGIRYLWIDSLCILQGDQEDWEKESSRMGLIYRDSTFTIAASNAAADIEGFLKPRPLTNSTIKFISVEGHTAEAYLRTEQQDRSFETWGKKFPLDMRGWCLQEAYLPNRMIKFLDNHIVWRCQQFTWDEWIDSAGGYGTGNPFTAQEIFRNETAREPRPMRVLTPYQGWYRMIREYTKRGLTYNSDKLPGVAGLAALVAEHDDGKYCAGVWREDMVFGLCWRKVSELERIEEYIAPSWSWASVKGPIEFIDANDVYSEQSDITIMTQVTVHDCYSAKRGLDKYGQIDMAWVHLEAPMTSIDASNDKTFQISNLETSEQTRLDFDFEREAGESMEGLKALFMMRRINTAKSQLQLYGHTKQPWRILLFGLIIRPAAHLLQTCKMYGLENNAPLYQRVGFFALFTTEARERKFWDKHASPIIIV